MKKTSLFLLPFFMCFGSLLRSQNNAAPLLLPQDAVRIALENNFDIRLSTAQRDIARLNNTRANAGMLPTVNLLVNETATYNAFQESTLADGRVIGAQGALNNNANASVQLNWTLFDGRRMFISKRRLEGLEKQNELQLQASVTNVATAVLTAYYDMVRSQMQEQAINELIELNQERLRIAEARLATGFAAQTDALQAGIDLNQRKADLLQQKALTAAAARQVNRLLVRAPETPFSVQPQIEAQYQPDASALRQKMAEQNPLLLVLKQNAMVADLAWQEARTLNKPRINGIASANALRSDNQASFQLNNTQFGMAVGAQLVVPLYAGGNLRRQADVAKVGIDVANLQMEQQKMQLEMVLENQLDFLKTQQDILNLTEKNIQNARENMKVSTERFRLGMTNGLEPQTAQNTLEQVLAQRNIVLYNLKITELQLRQLAGDMPF